MLNSEIYIYALNFLLVAFQCCNIARVFKIVRAKKKVNFLIAIMYIRPRWSKFELSNVIERIPVVE